jgi:pimeloyl-ACP methyl ester carboxylesterase
MNSFISATRCGRTIRRVLGLGALIVSVLIFGCVSNSEYRAAGLWANPANGDYELAFLEFTERGNLFHRDRLADLAQYLKQQQDALILVFVHGWKHNASEDDSNVQSFRKLLAQLASVNALGARKIIGIYLGWPGATLPVPLLQEVTFWARKAVAEEVGKGGATEVLLRLEAAAVPRGETNGNLFLVIGHSFGGAIVLSALNEVLLDKLIGADPSDQCYQPAWGEDTCQESCVRTEPFGHGVLVLNPAIEANHMLQLRGMVAENCYPKDQDKLLHVISSEADTATHRYFPLGQSIAMLLWDEKDIHRTYRGRPQTISEERLDRTTIGNLSQFWTGRLQKVGSDWRYCSYALDNFKNCPDLQPPADSIPTRSFEPVSFIYTDGEFMSDHNDVFNAKVAAYLGAVAMESRSRRNSFRAWDRPRHRAADLQGCQPEQGYYSFQRCFDQLNAIFADADGR